MSNVQSKKKSYLVEYVLLLTKKDKNQGRLRSTCCALKLVQCILFLARRECVLLGVRALKVLLVECVLLLTNKIHSLTFITYHVPQVLLVECVLLLTKMCSLSVECVLLFTGMCLKCSRSQGPVSRMCSLTCQNVFSVSRMCSRIYWNMFSQVFMIKVLLIECVFLLARLCSLTYQNVFSQVFALKVLDKTHLSKIDQVFALQKGLVSSSQLN